VPKSGSSPHVLVLTGTCGSGKTTVSTLLESLHGWARVCEDDIWRSRFGNARGAFGSAEHRRKRRAMHDVVFEECLPAIAAGRCVVVDATVHEAPPEAYGEYGEFFDEKGIPWRLRVLHPSLEAAITRDAARPSGRLGAERVASLRAKFTRAVFDEDCFVDTTDQTPEQTALGLLGESAHLVSERSRPCTRIRRVPGRS